MTNRADFLFELGTEELPANGQVELAISLRRNIVAGLVNEGLIDRSVDDGIEFVTPRRLAVLIPNLIGMQPSQLVERKGPTINLAFDKDGKPTPAAEGFARSCGVNMSDLIQEEGRLIYRGEQAGRRTVELLPQIVEEAIAALPIKKKMRWGNLPTEFVRPVHWVVMLYGEDIVDCTILGIKTGRETQGHRFHHPEKISIKKPREYEKLLEEKGFVIPNFQKRYSRIGEITAEIAKKMNADCIHSLYLIPEVTGLVEWPVGLSAKFDEKFLDLPFQVIETVMIHHQRCFFVFNKDNVAELLPRFIVISNIESKDPQQVIQGNERVMRARLADAEFFYDIDRKHSLLSRVESLKNIVFQEKLGTLYDKAKRLEKLTGYLAHDMREQGERAGLLAKADLVTEMVGEFPELQGTMGRYYARFADNLDQRESEAVAKAIGEHYLPKLAGDALPPTQLGCALAIADRLDTLVGIFGIGQAPTGDKDPFGLRRAALGILRIVLEKEEFVNFDFPLNEWITVATKNYQVKLPNTNVVSEVKEFIIERLAGWYQDKGISADKLSAVLSVNNENIHDVHARVLAITGFSKRVEANDLVTANKRVANILRKEKVEDFDINFAFEKINESGLKESAEIDLYKLIQTISKNTNLKKGFEKLNNSQEHYSQLLDNLAKLHLPLNRFFDEVLVNADDPALKNNRLALLNTLRGLFLKVADISLLSGS